MVGRLTSLAAVALLASCAAPDARRSAAPSPPVNDGAAAALLAPSLDDTAPRDYPGLHNVVAYHAGFYSGSVPEGAPGFDTLERLNVRTIISVDGAIPDVAAARARGIRYVHLPIGYNGFDEQRRLQLVRATRDALAAGPAYIHCHHGKHRSAGAAAAIIASLGWATPDEMVGRMRVSGTAPSYKGLYACAANATVITAGVIDAAPADFPEVSRPGGFLKGMIELDDIETHLKAIEKADWKPPADHPDLVPVAEAGRMVDVLRVLADGERARAEIADFAAMLRANAAHAQELEDLLAADRAEPAALSAQFKVVAASCKQCHVRFRD